MFEAEGEALNRASAALLLAFGFNPNTAMPTQAFPRPPAAAGDGGVAGAWQGSAHGPGHGLKTLRFPFRVYRINPCRESLHPPEAWSEIQFFFRFRVQGFVQPMRIEFGHRVGDQLLIDCMVLDCL